MPAFGYRAVQKATGLVLAAGTLFVPNQVVDVGLQRFMNRGFLQSIATDAQTPWKVGFIDAVDFVARHRSDVWNEFPPTGLEHPDWNAIGAEGEFDFAGATLSADADPWSIFVETVIEVTDVEIKGFYLRTSGAFGTGLLWSTAELTGTLPCVGVVEVTVRYYLNAPPEAP